MAQKESLAALTLENISVDEEGRVIITDPELAKRLREAVGAAQRLFGNGNCHGCNSVRGCGEGSNTAMGCGAATVR
jgi:hypothetical protein